MCKRVKHLLQSLNLFKKNVNKVSTIDLETGGLAGRRTLSVARDKTYGVALVLWANRMSGDIKSKHLRGTWLQLNHTLSAHFLESIQLRLIYALKIPLTIKS